MLRRDLKNGYCQKCRGRPDSGILALHCLSSYGEWTMDDVRRHFPVTCFQCRASSYGWSWVSWLSWLLVTNRFWCLIWQWSYLPFLLKFQFHCHTVHKLVSVTTYLSSLWSSSSWSLLWQTVTRNAMCYLCSYHFQPLPTSSCCCSQPRSVSFDTTDHDILLHSLKRWFGLSGLAFGWLHLICILIHSISSQVII